jgi:hypothetical protein
MRLKKALTEKNEIKVAPVAAVIPNQQVVQKPLSEDE